MDPQSIALINEHFCFFFMESGITPPPPLCLMSGINSGPVKKSVLARPHQVQMELAVAVGGGECVCVGGASH